MEDLAALSKRVRQLESAFKKIKTAPAINEHWITANALSKIVGTDNQGLRKMRDQGLVKYAESEGGGWVYLLESVPEALLKKKLTIKSTL